MKQRDFAELSLGFDSPGAGDEERFAARKGAELISIVGAICDYHTHKVVADALGRKPATLTQAIKPGVAANRNHVYLRELPRLILLDPTGDLVACISSVASEPWTSDEVAVAMTEAARELLGGELHKGFLRATKARLQRNRLKAVK